MSHALTETIQIEGKSDSFPPRFDPTDSNDFDLSKTEKSLPVAAVSANAQQITIQKRDGEISKLEDRLDVIANATYGGTTFETRLKEGRLTEDAQPPVDLITDPDPFMIMAGEKSSGVLDVTPLPYSVNVCNSIVLRHWMSAEVLGGDGTSITNHGRTSGRLVIRADGGATTLDMQTMEDGTPESEEKFLIAFQFEGHTPITPKRRAVNTITSDSATKMVVVKVMDGVTSKPSQNLIYLCGVTSGVLTDRPRATWREDEKSELSVTRIGDAVLSDVPIPFKFKEFPADETISSDDRTPASMSIRNVQEPGSIKLQFTDDSMDKGYNEFLAIKIDDDSECWLSGNTKVERSRFEIMVDIEVTLANQLNVSAAALTQAMGARWAACQLQFTRRPKADPTGTTPFGSAGNYEGIAGVNR